MLYTKIQPQNFLSSGEEDFKCFTIYRHGSHLVPWRGSICTNRQHPIDRRPHVQSGESGSSGFRNEDA